MASETDNVSSAMNRVFLESTETSGIRLWLSKMMGILLVPYLSCAIVPHKK